MAESPERYAKSRSGPASRQFAVEIDRSSGVGLVEQIASKLSEAVANGHLTPGSKLPSVRKLAEQLGVSAFTVAGAYDLLTARHVVSARRGAGYFVPQRGSLVSLVPEEARAEASSISDFWLSSDVFAHGRLLASPGCGWLPSDWYSDRTVISNAIRRVARSKPEQLVSYGHPAGYHRLRQHIARELSERSLTITPDQIVLTHGVTHALDLVVRTCLQPGDAVLVESPGYSNLNGLIARHGCKLLPVARGQDGLDLDAAAQLAQMHRPKAMFVTTVLHNPLGTTLRPTDAYRLLALAERFHFLIIEDDICRRFGTDFDPCLAAMDGLSRVISVNGYSKTIAPSLRSGYVACNRNMVEDILRTKMVTGLTTSEVSERIVLEVLSDPNHRRSVERISTRMTQAREAYRSVLEEAGLCLLAVPDGGMFLSAGWPVAPTKTCDARHIAEDALKEGLILAPGNFFHVSPPDRIWFRFNVAHQDTERLQTFLRRVPQRYGWH
ncbi:PLP-dependent aminotransferase family protein [Hyphomicrobium sp.]|uniref:aminotransferase-like domain-containing protein n=1 Tax=Hyphomicrobium sp. TaxID=82 RepID=UPI001D380346|nr:PLP-dependent aminotransferase family protein [Hyphomicrobium sp.]MBY0558545.1 PLP-dependent aminotransferase family protein [Hyphomicrobium sp.]